MRRASLIRWRPSPAAGGLAAAALFVHMTSGCLSNEYRIPNDELRRLAQLPPEARGQRVRLEQEVGERRGDAVQAVRQPPPPPEEAPRSPEESETYVDVRIDGGDCCTTGGGGGSWRGGSSPAPGGSWRGSSPSSPTTPPSSWRGGTASAPSSGFHGTPPGSGFHGSPPRGGGGGGVHVGGSGGGGGGSGSGGDAMVVLAVVLVAVALVATVGLVAGEGTHFDGYVQMAPDQPLHLRDPGGHTTEVPLGALTVEEAALTSEAKVMDDEGGGLWRLDEVPLDRRGFAFRFEMGTSSFNYGTTQLMGPAAHIQLGGFATRRVGFMFDIGLSGASDDCCLGTVTRHSLALELDALPLVAGRFHAGVFAKGGVAISGPSGFYETGPLGGGGALVELDLTPHMALALHAGVSTARLDTSGWSTAGTVTGGLTIY
jgi:hypothetical protein